MYLIPMLATTLITITVHYIISSPAGEWLYTFDLSSIRLCPYAPGHASVMGWFEVKTPTAGLVSTNVDLCPRTILRRVTEYVS